MSLRPVVCGFAVALLLAGSVFAQTPPAPAPATPAPAVPATPAEPATPATPAEPATPKAAAPQPADPFGEEVTLPARTIVFVKGTATWDAAFETLLKAIKTVTAFLDKQGIKAAGPAMTIYVQTDDLGFQFQAGVPVDNAPKNPPRNLTVGKSPDGKMLKFVHRGSYDAMDSTYEAITNHLDEKRLEAKDMFIEEYVTDPVKTPEDKLVVNVFVPIK
jgi:effector-binding domain-containing protein